MNKIVADETEDEGTIDDEKFWESVEHKALARIFLNCVMQKIKNKIKF